MAPKKRQTYLNLQLTQNEESMFIKKLAELDLKGRQVLRTLVRKWLNGEIE